MESIAKVKQDSIVFFENGDTYEISVSGNIYRNGKTIGKVERNDKTI